jgi:hypothetical protein
MDRLNLIGLLNATLCGDLPDAAWITLGAPALRDRT